MELKYSIGEYHIPARENGFNRTFMELKFIIVIRYFYYDAGFNRTFMELKFA